MKKKKRLIIAALCIIVVCFCSIIIKDKEEIKTIKSEKQLQKIYDDGEYAEMTFLEKMATLPFSAFMFDRYYYSGRKYINNWNYVEDYATVNEAVDAVPKDSKAGSSTDDYSKTNIQVEGVDEADIIKTDGEYIYSISGYDVIITDVRDPENVKIISQIHNSAIPSDLLLYENKLVVISSDVSQNLNEQNTDVRIYNINDRNNPKQEKSFELKEAYYTTRCIDGRLYIFSKGALRESNDKIVRKYVEDNKTKEIPLNHIKYLKDNPTRIQTLIAELDLNELNDIKLNSYLMDISNAYVSKDNIYLLKTEYGNDSKIGLKSIFGWKGIFGIFDSYEFDYDYYTHIYKFSIDKKKGVDLKSTNKVKGEIINQYSLDEKDNNIRIALETDDGTKIAILDKNLKLIGETDPVAEGERMYASRFMGDRAYLVTYRNTDPLFVIDLSNPKDPKVLGELKIPGYSTYLHPYDENHLIGIGMNSDEVIDRDENGHVISEWATITGMKMSLFDVSDVHNPKELDHTTIGDSRTVSAILTNPKALLFSKEKELLAIPVNHYEEDFIYEEEETYEEELDYYSRNNNYIAEGYFVYKINLDGFKLKGVITHNKTKDRYYYYYNSKLLRGVYIKDNLFTVSEDAIKVNELEDLKEISSIKINEKGEK